MSEDMRFIPLPELAVVSDTPLFTLSEPTESETIAASGTNTALKAERIKTLEAAATTHFYLLSQ